MNGAYISMMIKIAPETARAQTSNVAITVALGGAKIPKLMKIAISHDVTAINSGIDIEACSASRYINQ